MTDKIVLAHEPAFAIGPLEVRPATRTVLRDGREEVLEPRVMQVLVALARAGGQVVSRDDLAASCWDGRVVGDDAINRVLSRLRRLAEGIGADAFAIETITRIGYRMISLASPPVPVPVPAAVPPADAKRQPSRRALIAAGGVGAVALAGGGLWWAIHGAPTLPAAAQRAMQTGLDAMREGTPDQVSAAIGAYRQATALAPNAPAPWAALALAYAAQATASGHPDQAALAAGRTREAATRALALDSGNVDARVALATLVPVYRNWDAATAAIVSLVEAHPHNLSANALAMPFFARTGEIGRVLVCTREALALDPDWPKFYGHMMVSSWVLGKPDQAEAAINTAFQRWPRHYSIWFNRLIFLTFTGRASEALAMLADVDNRPIGIPDWNFENARLQAQAMLTRSPGDIAAAVRSYDEIAPRGNGFMLNAILFLSEMGLIDKAIALTGAMFAPGGQMPTSRYSAEQGQFTAKKERDTWVFWYPMAARLRADPRLLPILKGTGLIDYWHEKGIKPDVAIAGL